MKLTKTQAKNILKSAESIRLSTPLNDLLDAIAHGELNCDIGFVQTDKPILEKLGYKVSENDLIN